MSHSHEHGRGHEHTPKLTPGRKAALDALVNAGRALGAYDLIEILQKQEGRRLAPAQIYRALDYLVEQGLAHRLASRNAFLACGHQHRRSEPVAFLICEACGRVEEAAAGALGKAIEELAQTRKFVARPQTIEISGLCAECAA